MPFTLVQPFMCRGKVVYFYRVYDVVELWNKRVKQ
jgi:hypothetical protein